MNCQRPGIRYKERNSLTLHDELAAWIFAAQRADLDIPFNPRGGDHFFVRIVREMVIVVAGHTSPSCIAVPIERMDTSNVEQTRPMTPDPRTSIILIGN